MKNIYSVVLLFISLVFLSGKEVDLVKKKEIREGKYAISDSLYYKTYNQLWKLFISHHKDSVFIKKLSNTYLSKAKKDKDSVEIANGYRIFLETNVNNSGVALMYADSMIAITKGIKHEYYPARGYLLKGYLLQRIEKYNEALDFYLIAKKYAEINKNMEHIIAIKHNIAILKTTLGKDQEALETHIENYNLLTTRDTVNTFRSEYIGTLYRLSDSYNRLQKYDTAQYYLKKGITASLSGDTPHFYPNLLSSYGVNSYYRNEYTSALDSLQKSIALSKENSYGNFVVTYLYLGKTLLKLNKEKQAITYLKKVDSTVNIFNYSTETRQAFTLLIEHYKKKNDKENQLRIMEKLIKLDSAFTIKYKKLHIGIVEKYDNAQLIKEKNALVNSIENQNKKSKNQILLFGGLLIISLSGIYFYYYKKRNRKYEKVYQEKLVKIENLHKKKKQKARDIELAPELKLEILKKLEEYEENNFFLKNDLTLLTVAKKLKTNSTYLSKIINMDKQKNFANYINDLRIEYCVEQISNNKKFRNYSITSMANEVGFNNIQSFAKAFYKKNGCNPAEYVKNIDNQ